MQYTYMCMYEGFVRMHEMSNVYRYHKEGSFLVEMCLEHPIRKKKRNLIPLKLFKTDFSGIDRARTD